MDNKKRETLAEQMRRLLRGTPAGPASDRDHRQTNPAPRKSQDVVIGLDFGTSCTKVVIRDPVLRKAWAVPFGELAVKGNAYLLPTKLVVGNGSASLSGPGRIVLDLKLQLMAKPDAPVTQLGASGDAPTPRQLCGAYLALVLRRARAWFAAEHADLYRGVEPAWKVNVGIPSCTVSDAAQADAFEQVGRAAWHLSLRGEPLKWSDVVSADQASRGRSFNFGLTPASLHVYPEIAAEVTGYARSDARLPGLHLMIDIGASTLDISTFMLHEGDGTDNVGFLQTEVQKLGAFYLHRHRVKSLSRVISSRFNPLDIFKPTPDDIHEMLPSDAEVVAIDTQFSDAARGLLSDVIVTTKKRRASGEPQFQLNEPKALPVFVCGGGSQLRFYQEVIRKFDEALTKARFVGRLDIQPLPVPPQLEVPDLPASDYHRLAVAYGLSFRHLDLPTVTAPNDIPDVETMKVREQAELISKDMV